MRISRGGRVMRVIVAGSRSISDPLLVAEAVNRSGFIVTRVISGGAAGVDRLGEQWAMERGITIERYLPDWSLGRGAGFIRNQKMAENAEALIAVWDGN